MFFDVARCPVLSRTAWYFVDMSRNKLKVKYLVFFCPFNYFGYHKINKQELISRLDSRTLRAVNILGLLE